LGVGGRAPCEKCVIGPKDVTSDSYEIGLLIRGLCFRSGEANDHVNNFGLGDDFPSPKAFVPSNAKFAFPTGAGEIVQHRPFVVRAVSQTSDVEFEFDVTASFSVNYT
jgi:hypothetical protein